MALHSLIFATYAFLAGWAGLGLPLLFEDSGTLNTVLLGAVVFLGAAILHVLYFLRHQRQEQAYELDTVREAMTDALQQIEAVRKTHSDLRAEIVDAKHQYREADIRAAELLEKEVLQNVLEKLERLASAEGPVPSNVPSNIVDGPKPGSVKAGNKS